MQLESEIGDQAKHVLKNVAKVERFVVEMLQKYVTDHLVPPRHLQFHLDRVPVPDID